MIGSFGAPEWSQVGYKRELTFHVEPGAGRQLAQFEGIDRLILGVAVLHLQCVDHALAGHLVFVAGLQLHTVLDPLGSLHLGVGQVQGEHSLLGLCHRLVPQGLLDLHRCNQSNNTT